MYIHLQLKCHRKIVKKKIELLRDTMILTLSEHRKISTITSYLITVKTAKANSNRAVGTEVKESKFHEGNCFWANSFPLLFRHNSLFNKAFIAGLVFAESFSLQLKHGDNKWAVICSQCSSLKPDAMEHSLKPPAPLTFTDRNLGQQKGLLKGSIQAVQRSDTVRRGLHQESKTFVLPLKGTEQRDMHHSKAEHRFYHCSNSWTPVQQVFPQMKWNCWWAHEIKLLGGTI